MLGFFFCSLVLCLVPEKHGEKKEFLFRIFFGLMAVKVDEKRNSREVFPLGYFRNLLILECQQKYLEKKGGKQFLENMLPNRKFLSFSFFSILITEKRFLCLLLNCLFLRAYFVLEVKTIGIYESFFLFLSFVLCTHISHLGGH